MYYKPRFEQLEARRLLKSFGPSWTYLPTGPGNATFDCFGMACVAIQGFYGTGGATFSFFGDSKTTANWYVKKANEEIRVDLPPLEGDHLRLVTINPKGPSFQGVVNNANAPRLKVTSQWDQDPNDKVFGPFLYNVSLPNKFNLQFEPALPPALTVMYQWGDERKWQEGTAIERNIASFPAGPTALNVRIVHGDRTLHTYNVAATVSVINSLSYDFTWEDRFGNKFAAEETRFLADVDAGGWTANIFAEYFPTPKAYAGYEFAIGIYRAQNTNQLLAAMPLTRTASSALGISAKATNISVGALFDDLVPGVGGVDYAARLIARPPGPNQLYSRGFTTTQPIETTILPTWMQIPATQLNERVKYQLNDDFEGTTAGYVMQIPAVELEHKFPDTRDTPLGIFDGRKTNASTSLKLKALASANRTTDPSIIAGTWSIQATLLDTQLTSYSGNVFPQSGINVETILEPHTLRLEGGGIHITTAPYQLATNRSLAAKSKNLLDLTVPLIMGGGAKVDAKINLTGDMQVTAKTISAGAEIMLRESAGRLFLDRDYSYVGLFVDANGEVDIKGEGSLGISAVISLPAGTPPDIANEINRFEVLRLIAEGTLSIDLAGVVQANFEGLLWSPTITFDETNVTARGEIDIKYDTCFFSDKTRYFLGLDPCGTDSKTLFKRAYGPVQLLRGTSSEGSEKRAGGASPHPWSVSTRSGLLDDGVLNFGPDSENGRVAFLAIENTSSDIVYIDAVELLGSGFRFIDVAPGVRGLLPGQAIEYPIEVLDANAGGTGSLRIRGGDSIAYEQQITLSSNPSIPLLDNRPHHVDEVLRHTEGMDWLYQAAATMGSGTYRLVSGPAHTTIDASSGVLTWAPPRDYLAGRYHFVVERSSSAATILRTIAVDFEKTNSPPQFNFIREVAVDQFQTAIVPLFAHDPDYPPQQLTYRLTGDVPTGLYLDRDNQIVWTPSAQTEPRTYFVNVEVSDDGHKARSATAVLPITVRPVNQTPIFSQEYFVTAREGELVELRVEATDVDSKAPTYRLEFGVPEGVILDPESGFISWIPGFAAGGQLHRLTVAAIDAEDPTLVAYTSVWIEVIDQPRSIAVVPREPFDTEIEIGQPFGMDLEVTDEENIPIYVEYELVETSDPEATINYLSGEFQWRPTTAGVFDFTILATAYGGGTARQAHYEFQLSVLEDEISPVLAVGMPNAVFAPVMTIEATDNVAVTELEFRFREPDSPWISVSWEGNVAIVDESLMAEAFGGELVAGDYEVQVRAMDAAGNSSLHSQFFSIDFDPPSPAIVSLESTTDSLPSGDFRTQYARVHLDALTEPHATVSITPAWELYPGLDVSLLTVAAEADAQGNAQLPGIVLPKFGKNSFDIVTTDVAGNSTYSTFVVSRLTLDGSLAPDGFGYRATRIGGDFQTIADPHKRLPFEDGTTSIHLTNDILPGFLFPFYGTQYESISIGKHGLLTFDSPADDDPSAFLPDAASIGAFWTSLQFIDETDGVYFDWTEQDGGNVLRVQWQGYAEAIPWIGAEEIADLFPVRWSAELHCLTGEVLLSFDQIVPSDNRFWQQEEAVFIKGAGDEPNGQRALVISQASTPFDLADNNTRISIQQVPEPFPPFLQASLTEDSFYNGLADVFFVSLPLTGRTFDASSVASLVWNDSLLPEHPIDLTPQIDERGFFHVDREMIETFLGMPLPQGQHAITLTATDGAGFRNQLELSLIVDDHAPTLDRWQASPGQSAIQVGDTISTNLLRIDLEGTTEPHAFIFVSDAEGSVYSATAGEDGKFYILELGLQEGENSIDIEIIDRVGNTYATSRMIERKLSLAPEPQPLLGYGPNSVAGYRPFGSVDVVASLPGRLTTDDAAVFLVAGRPGTRSVDLGAHSLRLPHGIFTGNLQLFVSTSGYVTIGDRLDESLAETPSFAAPDITLLAPLWSDWGVDPESESVVLGRFETDRGDGLADRLIIQWDVYNFSYSPGFDPNTAVFQIIFELNTLIPAAIAFQYFDLELQTQADGSPFPALIGMHWAIPGLVDNVELQRFESEVVRVIPDYCVQWEYSGITALIDIRQNNPFMAPSIALNFSDAVTGVDLSDLEWTRDGEPVVLSGLLLSGEARNYAINFTDPLPAGDYRLTIINDGSIQSTGESLASPTSSHFAIEAANAPPTDIVLSGTELPASVTEAIIGEISTVDVDPHPIIAWQTSDPRFFVDGQTLKFASTIPIHPLDESQVELTITATENGWVSHSVERKFTISVVGLPRLPEAVQLIGSTIDERIEGIYIGEIASADGYPASSHQLSTLDDRFRFAGTSLWLADSRYLDTAIDQSPVVDILFSSTDGEFERTFTLPITLRENSTPFRNPRNPLDVNNRGGVTAIDALIIINVLNRGNFPNGILPRARSGAQEFDRFYDVSGDNLIAPLDALRVINFLNRQPASGEGESRLRPFETDSSESVSGLDSNAVDAVWYDASMMMEAWFDRELIRNRLRPSAADRVRF